MSILEESHHIECYEDWYYSPSSPPPSSSPPVATEPAPGVEYPAEISQQVALVTGRIPWYGGKFGEVDDDENKHKDDEASDDWDEVDE